MYLQFYINENGDKVYTTKVCCWLLGVVRVSKLNLHCCYLLAFGLIYMLVRVCMCFCARVFIQMSSLHVEDCIELNFVEV